MIEAFTGQAIGFLQPSTHPQEAALGGVGLDAIGGAHLNRYSLFSVCCSDETHWSSFGLLFTREQLPPPLRSAAAADLGKRCTESHGSAFCDHGLRFVQTTAITQDSRQNPQTHMAHCLAARVEHIHSSRRQTVHLKS